MVTSLFPAMDLGASTPSVTLSDDVAGVLDVIARLLNTRLAAVSRIESTTYTVMAVVDQHHSLQAGQIFNLPDTLCMHMLESGQPLCISDTTQLPQLHSAATAVELNIRAYIGVPLCTHDGRVFGSLWGADSMARDFSSQDVELLLLMARLLSTEIEQDIRIRHSERLEQVMSMQPQTDHLTGLLSRASFVTALAKEASQRNRRRTHAVAVVLLNSTAALRIPQTPESRDTLRQALADIVMRTSRLMDCCARIDVDTFAVLLMETTANEVVAWHKRIETAIETWNRIHAANGLMLDIHVGIADNREASTTGRNETSVLDLAHRRAEDNQATYLTHYQDIQLLPTD